MEDHRGIYLISDAPPFGDFRPRAAYFGLPIELNCCYFSRPMPMEAEWLTRKSRIDTRLKQKGWQLVPFTPELDLKALDKTAVEELPTANGPADYGLFVGGKLLGIIEAKKITVNPQNVLEQAKRYARGVFAAAGEWIGTATELLKELSDLGGENPQKQWGWPKNGRAVSGQLKRIAPNLRAHGVIVNWLPRTSGRREIQILRTVTGM